MSIVSVMCMEFVISVPNVVRSRDATSCGGIYGLDVFVFVVVDYDHLWFRVAVDVRGYV